MEPTIDTGDVVVASPLRTVAEVPLGRVMVFEDPARITPDTTPRILIHRVITRNDDGSYTSAGDANRQWDTAALPREPDPGPGPAAGAVGRAADRVVLPRPVPQIMVAIAVQRAGGVDGGVGHRPPSPATARRAAWSHPTRRLRRPGRRIGSGAPSVVASVAIAVVVVGTASAGFRAETVNPGNAWAVITRTMLPYKTNVLADAPWGYYETEEASGGNATDSSGNNRTGSYGGTVTYRQTGARRPGCPATRFFSAATAA